MKGVTERLQRAYKQHNIQLFCKARYTIQNAVVHPKGPLDLGEKCGVIYECRCEQCVKLNVGEMERFLGKRTQEHDKSVKEDDLKSALSQHQVMTGHKVLNKSMIEGVRTIDSDTRNLHTKVKEVIHNKL